MRGRRGEVVVIALSEGKLSGKGIERTELARGVESFVIFAATALRFAAAAGRIRVG